MTVVQLMALHKYVGLGWKVYKRISKAENQKAVLNQFKAAMADGTITTREWADLGKAIGVVSGRPAK